MKNSGDVFYIERDRQTPSKKARFQKPNHKAPIGKIPHTTSDLLNSRSGSPGTSFIAIAICRRHRRQGFSALRLRWFVAVERCCRCCLLWRRRRALPWSTTFQFDGAAIFSRVPSSFKTVNPTIIKIPNYVFSMSALCRGFRLGYRTSCLWSSPGCSWSVE